MDLQLRGLTAARWTRTAALVAAALLASAAWADLFSPGDLAKPHESIEGISNCTKCHPAGGQLSQETCLDCHSELTGSIKSGGGLHGRLKGDARNCEKCHHEHQGRQASIIDWGGGGKKGFNHTRTGWSLKGKHAPVACEKCHDKRLMVSPVAIKLSARRTTYLGAPRPCEKCHFDEHRGQTEQPNCDACHDEKDWKSASGFSHDKSQYPLRGKHQRVKCKGCHPTLKDAEPPGFPAPVSETFLKFAPLEFSACTDCHRDIHDGKFGQRCQSCHTVQDWHIIRSASQERAFHDKTRFKLKGAHLDVECKDCHGPWPGQRAKFKGLQFRQCLDCHPDAHLGQLVDKKKPLDCDVCHSEEAFGVPKYGLEEHAKTKYPLEGAHAQVPCNACHAPTPALSNQIPRAVAKDLARKKRKQLFSTALFHWKNLESCDTCHTDVHEKQFAKREGGCASCHQADSFTNVKFDHAKDSRYALTGKHAELACGKCHYADKPGRAVQYAPLPMECEGCHADAHARQFVKDGAPTACKTCHDTGSWKQGPFKHEPPFTDFLLDGAHAKVECKACHQEYFVARGVKASRYLGLPRTCEGCHADFHQGAFQGFEP